MNELMLGIAARRLRLGIKVEKATADLPQTTQSALFNVVGGRVLITNILGEVTTAIQNQANNTKLVANPTTGTDVDLCAVLSIANDEVGTLYGITGTFGDAMIGVNAGAVPEMDKGAVVPVGTVDLSCAASNTGKVKWTLTYVPIDDGAYVTSA